MKKTFLAMAAIVLAEAVFPVKAKCQLYQSHSLDRHLEAGFSVGPTFFLGDLGGNSGKGSRFIRDINTAHIHLMAAAWLSYHSNDRFGVRAAIQYGKLSGDDKSIIAAGSDEMYRKQRNLDFKTNLFETYIAGEVYPTLFVGHQHKPAIRPYAVMGIGLFNFNPQGSFTDDEGNTQWVDLKPLRTEGQGFKEYPGRKDYALTQVNIPMGAGLKYVVNDRVNFSLELLYRKTFTDYIDDVSTEYVDPALFNVYLSEREAFIARRVADKVNALVDPNLTRNEPGVQRGNPSQNDSYFTTFFKAGVRLGKYRSSATIRKPMNRFGCPKVFL